MELSFHSDFRQSTRITVPNLHGIGCKSEGSQKLCHVRYQFTTNKRFTKRI